MQIQSRLLEILEQWVVGQIQVQRSQGNESLADGGEIAAGTLIPFRRYPAEPVVLSARWVGALHHSLMVGSPSLPGQPGAVGLPLRHVDVEQGSGGKRRLKNPARQEDGKAGGDEEVGILAVHLLGNGEGRHSEQSPFKRRSHRARVGDVIAQIHSPVDA